MLTQIAEFKNAEEANKWLEDNYNKINIVEFQYVGNRHYGTSILVVYKKDIRKRV